MAFNISPEVTFQEKDYSQVTRTQSDWIGATVGVAHWGPINEAYLVTQGEAEFQSMFGKPKEDTYLPYFAAADFMAYSDKLYFVRAASAAARNAVAVGKTPVLIKNDDDFAVATLSSHKFIAKYASVLGNDLLVDVVDSTGFNAWEYRSSFTTIPQAGEFQVAVIDRTGAFGGLVPQRKQKERLNLFGTPVIGTQQVDKVTFSGTIVNAATITIDGVESTVLVTDTLATARDRAITNLLNSGKYTSVVANDTAGVHIVITRKEYGSKPALVVVESDADLTVASSIQTAGTDTTDISLPAPLSSVTITATVGDKLSDIAAAFALEINTLITAEDVVVSMFESAAQKGNSIEFVRADYGKKTITVAAGTAAGITFKAEIFEQGTLGSIIEKYEVVTNTATDKDGYGETLYWFDLINKKSAFIRACDKTIALTAGTTAFEGGVSGTDNTSVIDELEYLSNAETISLNYIIAGHFDVEGQRKAVEIADTRRDCIAFISPMFDDVVNALSPLTNVVEWRENEFGQSSSYAVMDCNWGLVYDTYNDKNRWIPCASGTAGLLARVSRIQNAWTSPAGYTNGRYKNYQRLAWSPNKAQRDELFRRSVNPIIASPGDGIVLLGDKTALNRASAFDQIHVRSLFIVVEKSIANLAKQYLFTVNDQYTRANFANAIIPFLRNIQGARGMQDFRVVVDERNNTAQDLAENRMNGLVMIKPNYSIRYINLTFAALAPFVSFEEVEAAEGLQ